MTNARSTPVQESDLVELIATLRTRGGALAYGLIGESTALPLVRLRISAPPQKPAEPTDKNPFARAEKASSYAEKLKQYESKYQEWDKEANRRMEAFLEVVRQRITGLRKDRTSPVYEALGRAELFLSEPGAWHRALAASSFC
jgi:hypothetical protein